MKEKPLEVDHLVFKGDPSISTINVYTDRSKTKARQKERTVIGKETETENISNANTKQ